MNLPINADMVQLMLLAAGLVLLALCIRAASHSGPRTSRIITLAFVMLFAGALLTILDVLGIFSHSVPLATLFVVAGICVLLMGSRRLPDRGYPEDTRRASKRPWTAHGHIHHPPTTH